MSHYNSRLVRYLLPLLGLLLTPAVAYGSPTVTALREACSGVFPDVEAPEHLSCVGYIETVQAMHIVQGTTCEPASNAVEAAAIGLWLYLGQFPGHELAEPHVLDFLKLHAGCSPATSAYRLTEQQHPGRHAN